MRLMIETIPDERHVIANDRVGEIDRKFRTHAFVLCSSSRKIGDKLLELELEGATLELDFSHGWIGLDWNRRNTDVIASKPAASII